MALSPKTAHYGPITAVVVRSSKTCDWYYTEPEEDVSYRMELNAGKVKRVFRYNGRETAQRENVTFFDGDVFYTPPEDTSGLVLRYDEKEYRALVSQLRRHVGSVQGTPLVTAPTYQNGAVTVPPPLSLLPAGMCDWQPFGRWYQDFILAQALRDPSFRVSNAQAATVLPAPYLMAANVRGVFGRAMSPAMAALHAHASDADCF